MTFTSLAKFYPPVLCRLLAVEGRGDFIKALTTGQISQRSGLGIWTIQSLSHATSWDDVPFSVMLAFLRGCGIDFCDWRKMNRVKVFVRRMDNRVSPWRHLRRSGEWLSYYEPLLKLYARSLK